MPKLSELNTRHASDTAKDKAQSTYETAKDIAQSTYEAAREKAQRTYENVQDNLPFRKKKSQTALQIGLGLLQGLLAYNQRKSNRNLKKAQKKARKNLEQLQGTVQDTIQPAWLKTQATMLAGMEVAQEALEKNRKKAQKNLKKARKNLQSTVQPAWSKTQDALHTGMDVAHTAQKNVQHAASSALDMGGNLQDHYSQYKRKRHRARTLFRWGLLVGVILALLYTPIPGTEVRRRVMEQWQNYRSYLGIH